MSSQCIRCGKSLTKEDVGLHKKLLGRAAEEFMCIDCLAAEFKVSRQLLEEKIHQFRAMGCTLF